jgi:hydroxyacylglutathione hydrolase
MQSMRVSTIVNGRWRQNCHIVADAAGSALVVDPGSEWERIAAEVEGNHWRIAAIVNTHAHYDHVGAVAPLQERCGAPFYLHGADAALLKRANLYRMLFESRDAVRIPSISHDISTLPPTFTIGTFSISWIATPGHTDGSVCLRLDDMLFSGDTLMHDALGRTDLPGGNRDRLIASVRTLMDLPGETVVYAGHGPRTTLAAEFAPGSRVWQLLQ